ncbi:MAG: inorganic diphosphatase [Actinomycetota bacterium]|nr:inorganic diphosphatase [Actinomycetota bacterium]
MTADETVDVTVETPAGSRNKYEYDEQIGAMRLDRRLPSATIFPVDYGFIPETLGLDGDPLDAMVIVEDPTFPGCVVTARILGLFMMTDEHGSDAKLITVSESDARWGDATELEDIPQPLLDEIEHFFAVYKDLEPAKHSETAGFENRQRGIETLRAASRRYRESPGDRSSV